MKSSLMKIVIVLLSMQQSSYVFAYEQFNASQLKNVRQISNFILKSQSAEKRQVEMEAEKEMEILAATEIYIQEILNQVMNVTAENQVGNVRNNTVKTARIKKTAKPDTNKLITHLGSSKQIIEDQLPSHWSFWKKTNKADKRKQKVVDILSLVETEMQRDINAGVIDINKLKHLKDKIALKPHKVADNKDRPTFIPYAGAKKQISPPKKAVQ